MSSTPGDDGGPWVGRPASTWGRRAGLAVLAVLLLAMVAAVVAIWNVDRSISRVGVDGLGEPDAAQADDGSGEEPADAGGDARPLTVLVLGSDSREELTPEERARFNTGHAPGERTEVVALVRLDPDAEEVRVLNVPRDTLVTRCDGSRGRVNAAFAIGERQGTGGASCVVDTLNRFLGVTIDHVAKIDFRGFVDVVDALGGVSMYLDQPLQDDNAGLDLRAGCQRLDGTEALAFVRARGMDNDYGRIARQHRFVEELRRELAAVGVLEDLPRLLRVANAVASSLELDDTLTFGTLQELVRGHRRTLSGGIDAQAVPGSLERSNGMYFLLADEERAHEQVAWLLHGEDPAADDDGADRPSRSTTGPSAFGGPRVGGGAEASDADADEDAEAPVGAAVDERERCR